MGKCIMVGCDLHDKNMLLKIAQGRGKVVKRSYRNHRLRAKAGQRDTVRGRDATACDQVVAYWFEGSGSRGAVLGRVDNCCGLRRAECA